MDAILACEQAGVHCRIATPLLKINQKAFPELKKFADAHHMHLIPSADIIAQSDHGCGNRPWCKVCPAANFNATRNLFTPPPGHCDFAKVVREVYGNQK